MSDERRPARQEKIRDGIRGLSLTRTLIGARSHRFYLRPINHLEILLIRLLFVRENLFFLSGIVIEQC